MAATIVDRRATLERIARGTKIGNTIVLIILEPEDKDKEVAVDTTVDVDTDTDGDADAATMQGSSKPPCPFENYVRGVLKKTT